MPKVATEKVVLTKVVIESLQPRESSYLVHDANLRGLCVKVRPTGAKSFLVYKSVHGRPVKKSIGKWGEGAWNVVAARKEAQRLLGDLTHGPLPAKKVERTLGNVTELYTKQLVSQGARHPDYLVETMRASWAGLMNRTLDSIATVEIHETHNDISINRGKVAAARAVKVLRTLFSFAMDMGFTDRNPAKRVRVQDSKPRAVFLNADDLQVFHRALATMLPETQDYFGLLLLTGQRRSNVAGMRWADADIVRAEWTIPAADFKTGVAVTVPLVPEAVAILQRRASSSKDRWVFPSVKSACGHLVEPWYWLKELRGKMAELGCAKPFTIHDLRRTCASILTSQGVPLSTVAHTLGHANVNVTPTYARSDTEGVRRALVAASGTLMGVPRTA